jgi:hypothetical protein
MIRYDRKVSLLINQIIYYPSLEDTTEDLTKKEHITSQLSLASRTYELKFGVVDSER